MTIIKYKNVFAKGYTPNQCEEVFVIKKTVPWTYVMQDLNDGEIVGTFYEKNYKRQISQSLESKK